MQNSTTSNLEAVANSWELYKSYNDRLVKEITSKGSADPLTINAIEKLNNDIDENIIKSSRPKLEKSSPKAGNCEYKSAFCDYVRKGVDNDLRNIELKSLLSSSDKDGGYLVTPRVSELISQNLATECLMRKLASVTEVSSDAYEYVVDRDALTYGWVEEVDPRPDTKSGDLKKRSILVNEIYTQPKATQKLLDDAAIDIEQWLSEKISESFSIAENMAFINGDGKGKPKGILSYSEGEGDGHIQTLKCNALTADALLDLIYSLPEQFAKNGQMIMNRSVIHQIRALKCPSTGQYLWQPSLSEGLISSVFGITIHESSDMPALANGSYAIAYADFNAAYKIIDRAGIRILRDPFTDKPFVKFYSTKRVGGDVVNFNAIKLLKIA